nr:prolyl oligopeptidase family serine peptidase [Verrucomicrobiota bacterium JB025]
MPSLDAAPPAYPETRRGDVVETLHGVKIADPYRWLEDDNSAETKAWVEAQNEVTFGYLKAIPERAALLERLTELEYYARMNPPFKVKGRYFFSRNTGLQNQSVLYTASSLDAEPQVLLDPNTFSDDGTVALSGVNVSDDGKLVAYAVSKSGSDWKEWRVREVATARDLPDLVQWSKFSDASWSPDGAGFYYSAYDQPAAGEEFSAANINQKVYYHKLGTAQSEDALIYERPDQPRWGFDAHPTRDGRYLIISIRGGAGARNALYYKDLRKPDSRITHLIKGFEARHTVIDSEGDTLWVHTDSMAPRGRVIAVDMQNPGPHRWKNVIPQSEDTIRSVSRVGRQFVVSYMQDAHSVVRRYKTDGTSLGEIKLPGLGSAAGFIGRPDERETFYAFSSYTSPATIHRFDFDTGESTPYWQPDLEFDPDLYETRQQFYQSKDGTRVPMFIVSRKGLEADGSHPTLLYGYGGFNISMLPRFSSSLIGWLEQGGVYAVANLRGGGEYGENWHKGGMRENKQNGFDDFIAAAEWLVDHKITSPDHLAISGGSNGGLLVGACMTQRPDLFAAAIPSVGVLDMLRFHKFTIGWAWTKEYGNPDVGKDFKVIRAYSPLHNLKPGTRYPSTMITTGDHDDRVVPAHSFKFAAALQRAHRGDNPVLIRISTNAGHGAGKPTSMRLEEAADRWAFLLHELR